MEALELYKIVIDPGHGGRDPGAIGPTGLQEKVVNLAVAKLVAEILAPVAEVKLTRDTDIALGATLKADLLARVKVAEDWEADLVICIHCNSSASSAAHGGEVYTSPGQTQADILATCIIRAMEAALPEVTIRKDFSDGDSDKEAAFMVLMETNMPAVLPELAFISNPTEEDLLENPTFQVRAARAIAEGTAAYLGMQLPAPAPSDPVANAVAVLQAAGIINSPDYWLEHGRPGKLADGQYVGQLLQATAKKIRSA